MLRCGAAGGLTSAPLSWNQELARAAEARVHYYVSIGSSKEFLWRKAHAAVLAVEKEIRRLPSGLIVNMPRLKEKTTQQELEAIVRREKPAVPPEFALGGAASSSLSSELRDFKRHPYLNRMKYRGGGYAILMALHKRALQPGARHFMYKAELVREAQPFCDTSMLNTDRWVRSLSCGWASHRSLIEHRLIVAARGPGPGREEFQLTEDGRGFLNAMLQKWPLVETQGGGNNARDHRSRSRSPRRGTSRTTTAIPEVEGLPVEMSTALVAFGTPEEEEEKEEKEEEERACVGSVGSATHPFQDMPLVIAAPDTTLPLPRRKRPRWRQIRPDPVLAWGSASSSTASADKPVLEYGRSRECSEDRKALPRSIVEISSDEEDASASLCPIGTEHTVEAEFQGQDSKVRLVVDDRERYRDADPRGLLNRFTAAVQGRRSLVSQGHLRFGDYTWVAGADGRRLGECCMIGCVIERKRISDLVGRSALGTHLRQLERLECCSLPHAFFMIEGDQASASKCMAYDRPQTVDGLIGSSACSNGTSVIQSREDIDEFCAGLLVRQSCVGVVATRDAEASIRLLGLLTDWLEWRVSLHENIGAESSDTVMKQTMRAFEEAAEARAASRDELGQKLLSRGLNTETVDALRRRFRSFLEVRAALLRCTSNDERCHFFDCMPACTEPVERLCAAFDIAAEPHLPPVARRAIVSASSKVLRRLGAPGDSKQMAFKNVKCPLTDVDCIGYFQVVICAGLAGQFPRRSAGIEVFIFSAAALLREALATAARLGEKAPDVAIADGAAQAFDARMRAALPQASGTGLIIFEGLHAAVQAEARSPSRVQAPCETCSQGEHKRSLLPRLLGIAELAALLLDMRCGRRVRVHDVGAAETTACFLRTLTRVALEESTLTSPLQLGDCRLPGIARVRGA